MPFKFTKLEELSEVVLIEPKVFGDARGYFLESYSFRDFEKAGIIDIFVQDNQSKSQKGTLRGLHYQKEPYEQAKLIRVLSGEIFDVSVDIRKGSPTYAKWVGVLLSAENKKQLYIPAGFAHGFYAMSDAEILYKTQRFYSQEHERSIIWNDSTIGIKWPFTSEPLLSEKDRKNPTLQDADNDFFIRNRAIISIW